MGVIVEITNRRKSYDILVSRGAGNVVNSNGSYTSGVSSGETVVVPDSNITNSNGTYNVSLPATADLTVPDGSVRNSDNSWIAAVPAADGVVAPDIQVTDSDGSTYSYPSVKDVVCSLPVGSDVTNSDGSYNAHVNNGATLVLADVPNVDSDGSTVMTPAMTPFVATPCPVPSHPTTAMLTKTGQTTSYATGDDGDTERGRETDFFTLYENNYFGHKFRFTGITGGYYSGGWKSVTGAATTSALAFPSGIIIDWSLFEKSTGNVLFITYNYYSDWAQALTNALGLTIGGFTDWFLMNRKELDNLLYEESLRNLEYEPLTTIIGYVDVDAYWWTGTTPKCNTARAKAFGNINGVAGNVFDTFGKTLGGVRSMAVRAGNISEL